MMMPVKPPQERPIVLILAILLLAFAAATFILAPESFAIRSLGLLAILISGALIRRSKASARPASNLNGGELSTRKPDRRPGRVAWSTGVASLVAVGASYLYLHRDALHGGHREWPVYVFAGAVLACGGIWGFIAARFIW